MKRNSNYALSPQFFAGGLLDFDLFYCANQLAQTDGEAIFQWHW